MELETVLETITPVNDPSLPGRLRLLDAQGVELYATDIADPVGEADDDTLGAVALPMDDLMIETPQLVGVDTVEFLWNGVTADTLTRSANAPQVTIQSPPAGATLGVTTTVAWTVSDADGGVLTSYLEYSHDGSTTILPLTDDLSGGSHSVVINSSELAASGSGQLRVVATDGLNTSEASVTGLVVGPDKPPTVTLVSPADGSVYRSGGPAVVFVGTAHDLEDGALTGASLEWSSDLDGVLGNGEVLEATLSAGTHSITLKATDSNGGFTTTQITLLQQ